MNPQPESRFTIEPTGESQGHCACCGHDSRTVWGFVNDYGDATAAYFMQWTAGHLEDFGANLDLILGRWGDGATPADRFVVSLLHRRLADGSSGSMVIDAEGRPASDGRIAAHALRRDDVVGTSLAGQVFDLVDAICEQDGRFF